MKASDLKKPKTLIINRKKWWRGKGVRNSRLIKGNGMMCCVGFYGKSIGLSNKALLYKESLYDVSYYFKSVELKKELKEINRLLEIAYTTNDSEDISEKIRERDIKKVFKDELDIEVKFVD